MSKVVISIALGCVAICAQVVGAESNAYEKVLAKFQDVDLVCLGERHWSEHDAEFRIGLIRHRDFPSYVDDVVIEFGNSRYQNLLDAFYLRLEHIPMEELSWIWRNTTQRSGVWDSPIYEQFLREMREVNQGLPAKERVRVVAGGPPVDWSKVEVFEDLLPYMHRGWWAVRQIEREVLSKNRKGLVIYGLGHFLRVDGEMEEDDNIIRRLDALYPDRKFWVITPLYAVGGEPLKMPGFSKDSVYPVYLDAGTKPFTDWPTAEHLPDGAGTLKEAVDGLLYFGDVADPRIRPPGDLGETDQEYAKELERRRDLKRRIDRQQSYQ